MKKRCGPVKSRAVAFDCNSRYHGNTSIKLLEVLDLH